MPTIINPVFPILFRNLIKQIHPSDLFEFTINKTILNLMIYF